MRIVGLDGGMTRLGLAAVELKEDKIEVITYGLISHPRDATIKFNEHLTSGIEQITNDFPRFLGMINPGLIVSETIPVGKLGSNDSLVVAAITACKVISFQFGIPWMDIAASTVKVTVTGDGRATKTKIRNTVLDTYSLVERRHTKLKREQKEMNEKAEGLPQDVFDAIAVAWAGSIIYGRTQESTN